MTSRRDTRPAAVVRVQRERAALASRVAGRSYEEIGVELELSAAGACAVLHAALERLGRECREVAEEVRALELVRLDGLWAGVWDAARGGDLGAIATALRIQERRSRLLGLDQPQRVDWRTESVPAIAIEHRGLAPGEVPPATGSATPAPVSGGSDATG